MTELVFLHASELSFVQKENDQHTFGPRPNLSGNQGDLSIGSLSFPWASKIELSCARKNMSPREQLDKLFAFDAACSVVFGALALLTPHGIVSRLSEGGYSHAVHETFR